MTTRKTSRPAQSTKKPTPIAKPLAAKPPLKAKAPLRGKAKVLSSRLSFKARNFAVYTEEVLEPGGHRGIRNIIRHHGSVVVLAVDDTNPRDPSILLVRQYRHAAGQFLLELPAGHRDPGENYLAAAKRELAEETGFRARRWQRLITYYASPGFLGETMTIYLAQGLTPGVSAPEDDEHIELQHLRLSTLLKLIRSGKILDGKTIVGTLLYREGRRAGKAS